MIKFRDLIILCVDYYFIKDIVIIGMLFLFCGWLCIVIGLFIMFGYIICGVFLGFLGLNSIKFIV